MMFYLIRTQDGLRVEQDRSLNGLFPIQTWLYVLAEAGFTVEKWPYHVHEDGREAWLLVGVLG
ncbi:MAG TPA: hypothetical protein VHY08_03820 [Bacillota bacterium]|nr:hypothetical protein [Bacillota bacterium]